MSFGIGDKRKRGMSVAGFLRAVFHPLPSSSYPSIAPAVAPVSPPASAAAAPAVSSSAPAPPAVNEKTEIVIDGSWGIVPTGASASYGSTDGRMNEAETMLYNWAVEAEGSRPSNQRWTVFRSSQAMWSQMDPVRWRLKADGSNFDECFMVYLGSSLRDSVNKAASVFARNPVLKGFTMKQLILDRGLPPEKNKSVSGLFLELVHAFMDCNRLKGPKLKLAASVLSGLIKAVAGTCGCTYGL